MIAELRAAKARLETLWPGKVCIGDSSGLLPPYAMLWSPPGSRVVDEAHGGPDGEYAGRLGVTLVAATAEIALEMAEAAIQELTPRRRAARLDSDDRVAWITYRDVRDVQIDRQVTLPDSDTHPAYVPALFAVTSNPRSAD